MKYQSTKTYGHERGLSCCFRQWKADSHCNQLHGYALSFKFTFESVTLDARNWVMDFGGLNKLEDIMHRYFDHTLLVAKDDPELDAISALNCANVIIVDRVGCESFAEFALNLAKELFESHLTLSDHWVRVVSVECAEHGSNSAVVWA